MPIYSDINQYTPETQILLTDEESVYQSLNNILITKPGQRIFNPEFGSDMDKVLFEVMDEVTAAQLYRTVTEAVERWEPRIIIDNSQSDIIPNYDSNSYDVKLVFEIIGLSDEGQKFEFLGELSS